jgi:hypothetical protein
MGSTFIVHDGGKTLAELFCQGVPITASRLDSQEALARTYGVELFKNKTFRKICVSSDLERAIFDVAQCSASSMLDIVSHKPKFEERDDLSSRIDQALRAWQPESVREIASNVQVQGTAEKHRFSFVCYPSNGAPTVGLKILGSDAPFAAAERYAFLGLDLSGIDELNRWKRLAIIPNSDKWGKRAKSLVSRFSDDVLEVKKGHESISMRTLPVIMNQLIYSLSEIHI